MRHREVDTITTLKRILSGMCAFWAAFWYPSPDSPDRVWIQGNPEHFEGWFDDDGREQQYIWIDDTEYLVYRDDLIIIYYDEDEGVIEGEYAD